MSRMDGMSNESVYEHFGMRHVGEWKCGVVEEVKRQMLKWFGHMERMEEGKMARRVYVSEIEGGNVTGRPTVVWRDRVQEYVRERGEGSFRNLEWARRECQDGERWKLFCYGHPLVGARRSRHQNEMNWEKYAKLKEKLEDYDKAKDKGGIDDGKINEIKNAWKREQEEQVTFREVLHKQFEDQAKETVVKVIKETHILVRDTVEKKKCVVMTVRC